MSAERTETRAEEVARVRSYLVSQAAKGTPAQLVETLREAHRQFLAALDAVPEAAFRATPGADEWSAADVTEHVRQIAALEERSIVGVLARGERPAPIADRLTVAPSEATRAALLADIAAMRDRLCTAVLAASPEAQLDITWSHSEFGALNWREWLLFARVHTLDHARQLQAIAAALAERGQ